MSDEPLLAGRYRTVRRLGSGGMARVYLAEDERLDRPVAVKRLHAESPAEVARRFQREARLGASMSHPNLVAVYDVVSEADDVLLVMEYVDGPTLAQELTRGTLWPERAIEVVEQIAAALDHAHGQGVVHRDVKPANVLLGPRGVKVADLGIASAVEGTQITRTGSVLGTPSYMAPEQLEGRPLGPAADVYALAAVAFEALSGSRARQGRTPLEIAHRAVSAPPPDVRDAWPDAPAAVAAALGRGMCRDPDGRPDSAGALAAELAEALAPSGEAAAGTPGTTVAAPGSGGAGLASEPGEGPSSAPTAPSRTPARREPGAAGSATQAGRTERGTDRTAGGISRGSRPGRGRLVAAAALAAVVLLAGVAALLASTGAELPAPAPQPPAPEPEPARRGPPLDPDATVANFYRLSAGDRFDEAWRLAGAGWRAKLGGYESYRGTFSTLETIEFPRLETTSESRSSATVAARTVARHTDRTDRCTSTFQLVVRAGRWMIEDGSVACQ